MLTHQTLPSPDILPPKYSLLPALLVAVAWGVQWIRQYRKGQRALVEDEQRKLKAQVEAETTEVRQGLVDWREVADARLAVIGERERTIVEKEHDLQEERRQKANLVDKVRDLTDFNFTLQGELDKALRRQATLDARIAALEAEEETRTRKR